MMPLLRKLLRLTHRRRNEAELQEELQFHLDEEAADQAANGLSADDARRVARLDLGNPAIVREDTRAAWTWRLPEQILQDLRYGVRTLGANKTFSALAILSLALGIGANTAIFSFMDALLMRSLPVPDPESLVTLAWHTVRPEFHGSDRHDDSYIDPTGGYIGGIFSYGAFELFQRDSSLFTTVFGYQGTGNLSLIVGGQADVAPGEYVSGNYFTGLGVSPASGRLIAADDDRAGAPAVAVVSYSLSTARFGGAREAAGQSILIDNIPFIIIGVTPSDFFGADPDKVPSVYLPMHANLLLQPGNRRAASRYTSAYYDWVIPMARLRPGISAVQAQAALGPAFAAWKMATDPTGAKTNHPTLVVRPTAGGLDALQRRYAKPLYVLLGLVGLILAIACANVANLLLGRASARAREMAVRLSIGAGRGRVIRQLLTESLLLAGIGGAAGIAFAVWGIRFLTVLLANGPGGVPLASAVDLNWPVLGVTAMLSLVTGLLFGLAPAIQATRVDPISALKTDAARGTLASRGRRFPIAGALMVAQIVFTLMILVAAGLFLRTLSNLESIRLGFNAEHLLTFALNAREAGHRDPEIVTFYERLLSEFAAIPGVQAVTMSDETLLGGGYSGTDVTASGDQVKPSHVLMVGPGFFSAMQIPLLRGRPIDERDQPGSAYAAVVNQRFATTFLGTDDPIGRHVRMPHKSPGGCPTCDIQIVGLVANSLYGSLLDTPFTAAGPPPIIFLSLPQALLEPVAGATYELRTVGDPLTAVATVRDIVAHADGHVPVTQVKTQRALIDRQINPQIVFARLCSVFALLALTMACVGLYGTLSYGVSRRTREIGIRMALGARRGTVLRMVLGEVVAFAAIGVAISLPSALLASKVVRSFLFQTQPNDPLAFSAAVLTITAAMLLAGYLPARTACRIDPMIAIRHE